MTKNTSSTATSQDAEDGGAAQDEGAERHRDEGQRERRDDGEHREGGDGSPKDEGGERQRREGSPKDESDEQQRRDGQRPDREEQRREGTRRPGLSGDKAVEAAMRHVESLTGRSADTISGLSRNEEGWTVGVEVVELSRIPPSTDVLASYQVEVDGDGGLIEFERTRRYLRNQADEE